MLVCLLECFKREKKCDDAGMRGGKLRFIHWEGKSRVGPGNVWIDCSLIEDGRCGVFPPLLQLGRK